MSRMSGIVAAVLVALAVAGCQRGTGADPAAAAEPVRRVGTLAFTPCTLTSAQAAGNVEAQCARLSVPENPAAPGGRRIALKIAWLESDNAGRAAPDPVFFVAGGPGQSATEVASLVAPRLAEVRKQRDLFFVDQRGTGGSHPLRCTGADGQALEPEGGAAATAQQYTDYARRCAASLRGYADTRYYTTAEAIADLDAVRAALGVDRVNLIGGSYGTRVVQQYARRYAAHARTLTLDGVAPNALVIGGEFATTFEDAIAQQSAQCRRDPACARRFPVDTGAQLRAVTERLRAAPVEVDYRDPGTAQTRHDRATADSVVGLAFGFSYAPQTAALLPLVLDEAAAGRYAPLMALAQMTTGQMDGQINRAMQWSVLCAEDAGRYRAPPGVERTLLGAQVAQLFFAPCQVWAAGTPAADFTAPLRSDVPALLLSGELDPVTPPRYAEQVLKGLPHGRHIVSPGQGHGTFGLGCLPKLLGRFIDTADAARLDARCVQSMSSVPAFTSFNGWEP